MRLKIQSSVQIEQASSGKSSLLVPALQLGYFQNRCKQMGSKANYFHWMAVHYLPLLEKFYPALQSQRDPNWKKAYQKSGNDLQKKNFFPRADDWEHFRNVANACGVSICFLFVFLMRLEMDGFFAPALKNKSVGWNSTPPEADISGRSSFSSLFCQKINEAGETMTRQAVLERSIRKNHHASAQPGPVQQ